MARIRDDSEKLFELYAEIGMPATEDDKPFIIRVHPPNYSNKEILSSVPFFTYPCRFQCDVVTHFSFVLTNSSSKWTFGYCRHTPNTDHCVVILSDLPWHSTFYKILDFCIEIDSKQDGNQNLEKFLTALMSTELPQPGLDLCLTFPGDGFRLKNFKASVPDHQRLPSIPEDRNITEYFNAVTDTNMIAIFASMLSERRIVITSERLNRLSSCVQAANALIYPMHWQHIFIPLLPSHLIDYLSAPMPFLIGVPATTLAQMRPSELTDIVLLNVDTNELKTPFDDISTLPSDVLNSLRKALTKSSASLGDSLCRAFLRALVSLIGGYRSALKIVPGEQITFDNEKFVQNVRGTSRQLFLEKMLQLQIFQQFIETRLEMFNAEGTCDDQFEIELNNRETPSGNLFKSQYKEWTTTMKKEGGALVRAFNSKSKSAITKSRQAVRNLKHYIGTTPAGSAPASPKISSVGKSLKKSISGSAISQTSKTVTYVRNTNGVNSFSTMPTGNNGSSGKSKFYFSHTYDSSSSNNHLNVNNHHKNGNSLAPSASPESSDVEDEKFVFPDFRKLKINPPNSQSKTSGSSHSVSTANLLPIPPPRVNPSNRSTQRQNGCTMNTEKCLIEFDSPPKDKNKQRGLDANSSLLDEIMNDDLLAAFDPLRSGSIPDSSATLSSPKIAINNSNIPFNYNNHKPPWESLRESSLQLASRATYEISEKKPKQKRRSDDDVEESLIPQHHHHPQQDHPPPPPLSPQQQQQQQPFSGGNNLQSHAHVVCQSTMPPAGNTTNLLFFYEPNNNNFNVTLSRPESMAQYPGMMMTTTETITSPPPPPPPPTHHTVQQQTIAHRMTGPPTNIGTVFQHSPISSPFGDNFVPKGQLPLAITPLPVTAVKQSVQATGDVKQMPFRASNNWQEFD